MSYHVPLHDTWRPSDLAEALHELGIQAEVNDDRVLAVVPVVGIETILASTIGEELVRKKLGETNVSFSFSSEHLICNILVEFEVEALMSMSIKCPDFFSLTKAIEKCGYVWGSELEIVQLYLPDDSDASDLADEIEVLNLRKEDLIANQDFAGAGAVLRKQNVLRTQLEDKIRNRPR